MMLRASVPGTRTTWEPTMRVLLADDQPQVRFALRVLLEREPGLTIVGEATDGEGLLKHVAMTLPDVILLGWELPGLRATDSLPLLRRIRPGVLVIALSGRVEARLDALSAGADAFVSKGDPPEHLLATIRTEADTPG
jgi:DNA-binding NarL/FixJ family response regulator